MKKIFYEKIGRRYIPVSEYNSEWIDSFREGSHLIMCYPNGKSTRFNIDPNYAAMIAAGRIAEDIICDAMIEAQQLRPSKSPVTNEQMFHWRALARSFGKEEFPLSRPAAMDAARAAVEAMQNEAMKLMTNPAVKEAFEQFLLICELTKENHNER